MADLATILNDPNYVNANEATKAAIFLKYAPEDPNYVNANEATKQAIHEKFGVQGVAKQISESIATAMGSADAPSEIPAARAEPTTYETVREFVAPTVSMLGAAGGAYAGIPFGPPGIISGAGLGYGMAQEALNLADIYIGGKAPREGSAMVTEPVKNVLEGSTYEVGGRVVAPYVGKVIGAAMDLRQIPTQKAAKIARDALGDDLPQVLNALRTAPPNLSAAQATANITNPTWQALIERRLASDPKFVLNLKNMNEAEGVNALAKLAGGATATEVRATSDVAKSNLNAMTGPTRESALARANLGQTTKQYASDAERLAAEAAAKVQDVRRFTAAGPRAEALARTQLIEKGQPVGAAKYTYVGGDLPALAEKAAADAATGSLKLGEASRFSQAASDALNRAGIKPLETAPIVDSITQLASSTKYAGNRDVSTALKRVAQDVAEWTNKGGVIDAWALDAIRKNSVNAAIRDLYPAADIKVQKELAAGVLTKIKPVIVDAIESAGGTGYKQYLADYTKGMQQIAEKKLSGEALKLYKKDKDAFVRLVQGESDDVVEKILGPGSYDIAKEVSDKTLEVLQNQAIKAVRDANIKTQVSEGQKALEELLTQHISKLRLPSYINVYAATGNRAIDILETKIGAKTMQTLTEAFKTPGATADLLERLPGPERNRVAKLLSDPKSWVQKAAAPATIGVTNALAPENQNQNALAP
jgi:hypothetical protein